jgi:hypothetical protein
MKGRDMSGRKCSTITFDRERAQRQQILSKINNYTVNVEGIRRQIESALTSASLGVKQFFSTQTQRAERWIISVDRLKSSPSFSLSTSRSKLSERLSELESVAKEGRTLEKHLQHAFINEAGELRANAAKQIFYADSLLRRGEELLHLWFGSEEVNNFQTMVQRLRQDLEADRLEQVAQSSASLNQELLKKVQSAEANEAKHQSRLYVLKALRQVAANMGFDEIGKPKFSAPGDRSSRIVFTVDTINRGNVTFYLSLEGIEANSCISQTHCFEELGKLSKELAKAFGVQTKFRMSDQQSDPKLIRRGEVEEPMGSAMEAD